MLHAMAIDLLRCTHLSSTFIESFISFDSSLLQMFGHLLGLGSFDSPKGLIAHKQASLPIIFGGMKFILIVIIALIAYLGCWTFAASIIIVRFMVDQCPFLFETLTQINNNTFPFQKHLKVACDLLSPPARACFLSFEQLIRQQMV